MPPTGFEKYISTTNSWDWTSHCIERVNDALNRNESVTFVNGVGRAMAGFDQVKTWGISRATCNNICNSSVIPLKFQFEAFAAAFTSYLLPWLALIAQLPTQNGNKNDGFISVCMIIGSPALITYSLMLTIRNRYWVRSEFEKLRTQFSDINRSYAGFGEKLSAIQYVLEESQQVPLRVSQERGWFASLIVAEENDQWWTGLRKKLKNTRRGRTLSLIFQLLAAVVAWLFTVISAFVAYLGNITTATQLSAGSLWVWMVPIICGWIGIGTQQHSDSIDDALETETAYLAPQDLNPRHSELYHQNKIQHGLVIAGEGQSGLTTCTRFTTQQDVGDRYRTPGFFDLRGDEKLRGPLFNYARIFTYSHVVGHFRDALSVTMHNINGRKTVTGVPSLEGDLKRQLCGTTEQTTQYAGLLDKSIYAYPEWHEIDPFIWRGMLFSALLALFLQWGTTGAAIMIAYLTPIVGLGCRSGGYLIYGAVATVSWLLLAISSLFSHAAMLQYQREQQKLRQSSLTTADTDTLNREPSVQIPEDAEKTLAVNSSPHLHPLESKPSRSPTLNPTTTTTSNIPSHTHPQNLPPHPHPPPHHRIQNLIPVRPLAALTRYIGKTLAVTNAFFLVAISLAEFVGGYENCWCKADAPGLGAEGWVVLFKTGKDLEMAARLPWAMGVMVSIFVCVGSFGVFWGGM